MITARTCGSRISRRVWEGVSGLARVPAAGDQARADRRDTPLRDELFLRQPEALTQVPAVQVCPAEGRPEVEVRTERVEYPLERMEVVSVLLDQLLGRGMLVPSQRAPLVEP